MADALADGDAEGLALGRGLEDGEAEGRGLADGLGEAVGVGEADGVGETDGDGVGVGVGWLGVDPPDEGGAGVGVGAAATFTDTSKVCNPIATSELLMVASRNDGEEVVIVADRGVSGVQIEARFTLEVFRLVAPSGMTIIFTS